MTTTPTSGAAIQRYKIGYHADEWGQRSSTPSGIPDASGSWVRYEDHIAALAAGQATAAQQGAAYAALPDLSDADGEIWSAILDWGHAKRGADALRKASELERVLSDQMHAFADATCALRVSHGQALRLLTQKEKDSLGRRAEGMDGNEWDQWVQEKFAQVNGLRVQGGSYERDWE